MILIHQFLRQPPTAHFLPILPFQPQVWWVYYDFPSYLFPLCRILCPFFCTWKNPDFTSSIKSRYYLFCVGSTMFQGSWERPPVSPMTLHGSDSSTVWQPFKVRQLTTVFFPGKSHVQKSLAGYSPWGHKESEVT